LRLPLKDVAPSEWREVLRYFPELDRKELSYVHTDLQYIREVYVIQRKLLAGRPNRYEHRVLLKQMYGHSKALLRVMKQINFPLFYPEDLFPDLSLLRSIDRDEELQKDLEDVIKLLGIGLKSDRTLSMIRGESEEARGEKL
jgi:hypothetical protein